MRSGLLVLCVGSLAFLPVRAAAQQAPTLAVLDFDAFSVSLEDASAVGRGIAAMLTTEIAERPNVRVVDRQEIEALLDAQARSLGGKGDARAVQLGNLLGANYVLTGSVALDPKVVRVDLRLLEVETSRIHHAAKKQGEREKMLALVEEIADEFTRDLKLPLIARAEDLMIPPNATLAFSRGLAYEKRGDPRRAADMFRRALELFPDHPYARTALERVQRGGDR